MHLKRPVVGVISQPFMNRIVSCLTNCEAHSQFSARVGGGAFMNRTVPMPLTGGIPQPLTELSQCLIAAECEYEPGSYWASWSADC
jgi:myo-inositol-1(or 4)-monophosphatase